MPLTRYFFVAAVLLACGCTPRSVGEEYASRVTEEAAAATREYLQNSTVGDSISTDTTVTPYTVAAAATFARPRLLLLGPCSATLVFSYEYEGESVDGSAELRCSPETGTWRVQSVFMFFDT